MKIPKIVYSTWISHKPLPDRFNKYIESWKKFLPDYEIRMISMQNTPRNKFINRFIENQNYAVAAQYARCQRLFETGGLYFDIDIEVIKSFDNLLKYDMFAGIESDEIDHYVNNAIFGCCRDHPFMNECMEYMNNIDFNSKDIEVNTGPLMFTNILKSKGWIPSNMNSFFENSEWHAGVNNTNSQGSIQLFNSKYFYPYFYTEQFTPGCITKETFAIHHWSATWVNSVSIIVICNGSHEHLERTVKTAVSQTVKAIEIIMVYSGTLSSLEKDFAVKNKLKVLAAKSGDSEMINSAIEFAKGRWIIVLNAGDIIQHDFIERTIDKGDIVRTDNNDSSPKGVLFRRETWEENGSDYRFLFETERKSLRKNGIKETFVRLH